MTTQVVDFDARITWVIGDWFGSSNAIASTARGLDIGRFSIVKRVMVPAGCLSIALSGATHAVLFSALLLGFRQSYCCRTCGVAWSTVVYEATFQNTHFTVLNNARSIEGMVLSWRYTRLFWSFSGHIPWKKDQFLVITLLINHWVCKMVSGWLKSGRVSKSVDRIEPPPRLEPWTVQGYPLHNSTINQSSKTSSRCKFITLVCHCGCSYWCQIRDTSK